MTKSKAAVQALADMDPQFAELCDTLFGKALDPVDIWAYVYTPEGVSKMLADAEVRKAAPDQADLNAGGEPAPKKRKPPTRKARPRFQPTGGTIEKSAVVPTAKRTGKFVKRTTGTLATGVVGGVIANQIPQQRTSSNEVVARLKKSDTTDFTMDVEFVKADNEKHQVFGWASIVEMGGQPIVDRQGDWISPEEIEKAAYTYVVKSRAGGNQHKRTETGEVFKASDMIESFVITDEKVEKMGLPDDTPRGWWVGYKISDEDAWEKVKDGRVTGFSIHGRGKRREVASA